MSSRFTNRLQRLSNFEKVSIFSGQENLEQQQRIDEISSRFEQEWHEGSQEKIEQLIRDSLEEDRERLLIELVLIEIELLQRQGVAAKPEDYIERFPEFTERLKRLSNKVQLLRHASSDQDITLIDSDARYACVSEIARGGMGIVFRGWDRILDRPVAIKVISRAIAGDPEARARFYREPRICGSLQHPNIVPIYDVGKTVDGDDFFVMKLIEGETLAEYMNGSHRLRNQQEWLSVFVKIASAIAAAHRIGIFHRDIKPSNIMLSEYGEVYVMDWGLSGSDPGSQQKSPVANQLSLSTPPSDASEVESNLTKGGGLFGTKNYMPPELESNQSDRSNPRVDVYSLGAVLCEFLTGKTPRQLLTDENSPNNDSLGVLLAQLVNESQLRAILLKSLATNPANRHQDAAEMLNEIESYRNSLSERIRAAEKQAQVATYQARMTGLRWRTAALLTAGCFVVFALLYWTNQRINSIADEQYNDARVAYSKAEAAFETAVASQDFSESNWEFVREIYNVAQTLVDKHGDPDLKLRSEAFSSKLNLITDLSSAVNVPYDPLSGNLDSKRSIRTYLDALRRFGFDPKGMTTAEARAKLQQLGPNLDRLITEQLIYFTLTEDLEDQAWWIQLAEQSEAESLKSSMTRAIAAGNAKYLKDYADTQDLTRLSSMVLNRLAMALRRYDYKEQAEKTYRTALKLYPYDAMTNNDFGVFLYVTPPHRNLEALTYFGAAMAVSSLPDIKWNYADCLIRAGDKEGGFAYIEELLTQFPENEYGRVRLAKYWLQSGRASEGEELLMPLLEKNPPSPAALLILAQIRYSEGRWSKVDEYLNKVQVTEPVDFNSLIRLAELKKDLGHVNAAIEIAQSLDDIDNYDFLEQGQLHYFLAGVYTQAEDFETGIKHYNTAIRFNSLPALGYFNLGYALRSLGKSEEAVQFLQRGQELVAQMDDWNLPSEQWAIDAQHETDAIREMLNSGLPPSEVIVSIEDDARNILVPHGQLFAALELLKKIPIEEATTDQLLLEATTAAKLLVSDPDTIPGMAIAALRLSVMEQMVVCLDKLLERWKIGPNVEASPYEQLVQLRLTQQLRSLEILKDENFLSLLPRGYQDSVISFWQTIDRRITVLNQVIP